MKVNYVCYHMQKSCSYKLVNFSMFSLAIFLIQNHSKPTRQSKPSTFNKTASTLLPTVLHVSMVGCTATQDQSGTSAAVATATILATPALCVPTLELYYHLLTHYTCRLYGQHNV